jgi:hypothetical protein
MIHLISYGDNLYKNSKKRIYLEANNTGWFDTITVYGPEDIDDAFKERFHTILNKKRGGGYWLWKSYFIKKKIDEINENDILIYIDAGCTINSNGKNRFYEYIEMLNSGDEGNISFQMGHIEKEWTTREIFEYFNVNDNNEIKNSGQILSTIRIMKKNENLIKILDLEMKTYQDNPLLITDYYNSNNQESCFKDNRHDQSVCSVIRKINKTILLTDESWFKFGDEKSLKYPFWATRRRG